MSEGSTPVLVGDPFPQFALPNNLDKQTRKDLKIPEKESIGLEDVPFEIILIEFLNVHCHTCKEQVPIFNQLWQAIKDDRVLKSRATMLGITVGNNVEEIKAFQKSFDAVYPLLADASKNVYDSMGDLKGTPQTYLLQKDASGTWYIVYHHSGAVSSHEVYLKKIEDLLKRDLEGIEPGYNVPQIFFTSLKQSYPEESFKQKRLILYFPVETTFPLEGDMRNKAPQMKVLRSLVSEGDNTLIIAGSLGRVFPEPDLKALQETPDIFLLGDDDKAIANRFNVAEEPLIILVNKSGRIVYRASSLTLVRAQELLQGKTAQLTPNLTERELLNLMKGSMKAVKDSIVKVDKKELENGVTLYLGFENEQTPEACLFGRIISKYSICDVCHDVHFYYLMDPHGKLIYFNPIHVTKYGNINWNPDDIVTIRSRILEKNLFQPLPFDPSVDAVSQATMSSFLIFEGLDETKIVLQDFYDAGFRKDYWRELCLQQLRTLKEIVELFKEQFPGDGFTKADQTTLDLDKLQDKLPAQTVPRCP
ncbi:MAG: TlpA disulfide reductase family protein, partial [Thermodesulfobacteriota bacterium]|nr:TlpA disulfide reductase family protein [Thermodesulfobacteriota bacterium]